MYTQIATRNSIILENGATTFPIATMADQFGGVAHIWIDDSCYMLGLESQIDGITRPTSHIFPEAMELLRKLPALNDYCKTNCSQYHFTLPNWLEAQEHCNTQQNPDPLDSFVYLYEPKANFYEWRKGLQAALEYAVKKESEIE